MIHESKKYQINIFGESYTIISDEPENEIMNVVTYINNSMNEISIKTGSKDTKKIAVLAALKIAKKLIELEENNKSKIVIESNLINKIDKELSFLQ